MAEKRKETSTSPHATPVSQDHEGVRICTTEPLRGGESGCFSQKKYNSKKHVPGALCNLPYCCCPSLTGLAPKALVVLAPKVVWAAPNAGVCCWVVLLPKGVADGTTAERKDRKSGTRGVAGGWVSKRCMYQ